MSSSFASTRLSYDAASRSWSEPLPELDSPRTLVLCFGASHFEPFQEALDAIQRVYPSSVILGCSTSGEIHGTEVRDDSLCVGIVRFAHTKLSVVSASIDHSEDSYEVGARIARELWREDDRLWRTWKDGRPTLNAYLEDYAYLAEGLIELYQTTFHDQWFVAARGLCDVILHQFQDGEGGFYDTSHDHEELVTRPRDVQDNATPSGGAMAATVLGRMHALTGEANYRTVAETALATVGPGAARYPTAFAQWLSAADFLVGKVTEVAVVGTPSERELLLEVVRETYRPRCVVAVGTGSDDVQVPLLHDRGLLDGGAAVYVCHGFECDLPTADPDHVRELLNA